MATNDTESIIFKHLKIQGKVLSVGKAASKVPGCSVTHRDIGDDVYLPELQKAFDWVYCYGSFALQSTKISSEYFASLCDYAKHVAVVYHTTQSGQKERNRVHHKKTTLDQAFGKNLVDSKMIGNFYVATLSQVRMDCGFITVEDIASATLNLIPKLPNDIHAVVSMHRSGSSPAAIIASILHVPCHLYSDSNGLIEMGGGGRTLEMREKGRCRLVIDDTVSTGKSIQRAKRWFDKNDPDNRYLYAAIFATQHGASELDFFAKTLRTPHLLEWNFMNSIAAKHALVDLDGVLCFDPPSFDETSEDGRAHYLEWVSSATVKYPARWGTLNSIVSYRCEYARSVTEALLEKSRIRFNKLHLFPGRPEERTFKASQWKGRIYKNRREQLFIESSAVQTRDIHQFSRKPVLDLEQRRMLGEQF